MVNNAITPKAQDHTESGKNSTHQARYAGQVPAVIYDHGVESRYPLLEEHATRLALRNNDNALIELNIVGGKTLPALTKDVQRRPTRLDAQHVDSFLVDHNERIGIEVPVTVIGETAPGTVHMIEAATIMASTPAVPMPEAIKVDVAGAAVSTVLTLTDIALSKGAEAVADAKIAVVSVANEHAVAPKVTEDAPTETAAKAETK